MIEIFTTPDGFTLSYERRGSGPLLVCHPGRPGRARRPSSRLRRARRHVRARAASARAARTDSDPADDYSLASYVADVEALREHLGVEQLDLLGFSHGGCVAMAYAAAHPARVSRLLLVDTLAVWGDEARGGDGSAGSRRAAASRGSRRRSGRSRRSRPASSPRPTSSIANLQRQIPLYFHRWEGNEQIGRELAMDFAHAEPLHHFNTVEFPTLRPARPSCGRSRLRRSSSPATTTSSAARSARRRSSASCPTARLVTIPDSGHFVYVEQPEAFRAALTDFLL